MTIPKERDVSKLPKWAQQELEMLRKNLAYWQKRALAGPDDSNTVLEPYAKGGRPLGTDVTVRFLLPNGWIDARTEDGRVLVRSSHQLVTLPHVTNTIYLEVRER